MPEKEKGQFQVEPESSEEAQEQDKEPDIDLVVQELITESTRTKKILDRLFKISIVFVDAEKDQLSESAQEFAEFDQGSNFTVEESRALYDLVASRLPRYVNKKLEEITFEPFKSPSGDQSTKKQMNNSRELLQYLKDNKDLIDRMEAKIADWDAREIPEKVYFDSLYKVDSPDLARALKSQGIESIQDVSNLFWPSQGNPNFHKIDNLRALHAVCDALNIEPKDVREQLEIGKKPFKVNVAELRNSVIAEVDKELKEKIIELKKEETNDLNIISREARDIRSQLSAREIEEVDSKFDSIVGYGLRRVGKDMTIEQIDEMAKGFHTKSGFLGKQKELAHYMEDEFLITHEMPNIDGDDSGSLEEQASGLQEQEVGTQEAVEQDTTEEREAVSKQILQTRKEIKKLEAQKKIAEQRVGEYTGVAGVVGSLGSLFAGKASQRSKQETRVRNRLKSTEQKIIQAQSRYKELQEQLRKFRNN